MDNTYNIKLYFDSKNKRYSLYRYNNDMVEISKEYTVNIKYNSHADKKHDIVYTCELKLETCNITNVFFDKDINIIHKKFKMLVGVQLLYFQK